MKGELTSPSQDSLDVLLSFHLGIPSIGSGLFGPVVEKLLRQDVPMAQKGSNSMGEHKTPMYGAVIWRGNFRGGFVC
jgi:hypothetical protein